MLADAVADGTDGTAERCGHELVTGPGALGLHAEYLHIEPVKLAIGGKVDDLNEIAVHQPTFIEASMPSALKKSAAAVTLS